MEDSSLMAMLNFKAPKTYSFQAKYRPISGTDRHCFLHPQNPAVAWELNGFDKSYKRPVCDGCAVPS